GGVHVEDDGGGRLPARADEQAHQVAVEDLQAPALGAIDLGEDGPLFGGQLGVAAAEGVLEAGHGAAGGQGPVGVGGDAGQDLEEGVVAGGVGVVVVGVAGQDLVDGLGEQGLGGVTGVAWGARVGESGGGVGEDAEVPVDGADREQAGVGDDPLAVEG